jgi:glycosyltransferase involved in cell wall biosynthesis
MKKILHIPNYYPPHIGGIEDVCYSIVSDISGYHHQVICFNDEKTTRQENYKGVEVIRCGVWKKLFSQSISLSLFWEMRKAFKVFQPDIVHFHGPNPLSSVYLLLSLPKKTKLIVHWHSDIIEQDLLYWFYRPIEKRLLQRADRILITSPTYLSGSMALQAWQHKIEIIPNTVNINKLQKRAGDDIEIEKIKKEYGGKKIVFTFGRQVLYKGLKYLVDAAPLLSDDAVIIISGKGPLHTELKEGAASSVYFIDRLTDDELRCYLYASDIFVFPSITRNEAFGIAMAEAMYCGLPTVTFTIPYSGVNWVSINGETGLEVENGNSQALADVINKLLKDSNLRKQLGANASLRIKENFIMDAVKGRLTLLYETV